MRPTITTDCANAITVEPRFVNELDIRLTVECDEHLGGCGWRYSFAGASYLRRIPWSRVLAEVERHLGAIPDPPTEEAP